MPTVIGYPPSDRHEKRVLALLKSQVPSDWTIVTNVAWTLATSNQNGPSYVRDGQSDFVILAPGHGLVVLEVKGYGHVRIDDGGQWFTKAGNQSHWRPLNDREPPPEQATRNMHEIVKMLNTHLGTTHLPTRYAWIVVYPNGHLDIAPSTYDPSTAVFRSQCGDLPSAIRHAIAVRGNNSLGANLDKALADRMAGILKNQSFRVVATSEDDGQRIDELTRQQFAALQGIFRYPKVAVTGPAGSGKTVLALWRLTSLREEGKNAVYLCYNRPLADYLRHAYPDLQDSIWTVDKYFTDIAGTEGVGDYYFSTELPGLVLDTVAGWSVGKKLDALIIDEGQDFGEYRILAAQEILKEDGCFLYCGDSKQDLYDRKTRNAVGAEVVFSLIHNCRNTTEINSAANRITAEQVPSMPGMPQGVPPEIRACGGGEPMAKAAWTVASKWLAEGLSVVILSPYVIENSCMVTMPAAFGKTLAYSLDESREPSRVLFSTVKKYKGLEADAVVIVDVGPSFVNFAEGNELYVACTRGKSRLAVMCTSQQVADRVRQGNDRNERAD